MRWLSIALGGWGLVVLLCVPAVARTSHDIHGGNCVAYARDLTGVHLDGNAGAWWSHAEGRYERGHKPQVGAILVFKPYGRMRVGHVAVVSRVISSREVLVDQANWVRGRVTKAISVVDASPANDWTSVKVEYASTHGRDNPTYGFIYPRTLPVNFAEASAIAATEPERHHSAHADRATAHARHHNSAPDEEVAAFRHAAPRHLAAADHPRHHKASVDHDEAQSDAPAKPPLQLASADTPHHKHKAHDTKVAYALY